MTTLPSIVTLMDWDQELLATAAWPELQRCLEQLPAIASSPNAIINLIHATGGTLSVGIAGKGDKDNPDLPKPLACVNHTPASGDPPYRSIIGDNDLNADDGVVVFRFENGTWTEIPRRNCVDMASMLVGVRHFCFNGTLAEHFDWEEI